MAGNGQLQELLFGLQNSANEKLFIDRCDILFETDDWKTWIDIYQPRTKEPTPAEATARRVGEDIDYLGRCDVAVYRETNVDDLRSRIEQISREQNVLTGLRLHKRPLFCIVRQRHSWSRLLTRQALLEYVLSTFDPKINDFILPFGVKLAETDIGGPRLWFYPASLRCAEQKQEEMKYYDCAYMLKYVERTRRDIPDRPWSERQTTIAIHHGEVSRWVLVSPSIEMQKYLDRYMCALKDNEHENPFSIHLLFIAAAMINWPTYLAYLTAETQEEANRAIVTSWENGEENMKTLHFEDSQKLQTIQDRVTDMFAMLDSTIDTTSSLEEKYYIFHLGLDAVTQSRIGADPIAFAFHETLKELKYQRQKLENLSRSIDAVVQFASSLLGLQNGQSLQALAEEARQEGKVMHCLTEKATQDAASVKVITIITMIYLPLTVVANFFSTVFVTRAADGPIGPVQVADNWWVLAAVGLPLTGLTFLLWWAISQRVFLLDALRRGLLMVKARRMEAVKALAWRKRSDNSLSDRQSLAGSAVMLGAALA